MLPDDLFKRWLESKDARAVSVRQDIIKGLFRCANFGFTSDLHYLTDRNVILDSIKRKGYKLTTAEEFVE